MWQYRHIHIVETICLVTRKNTNSINCTELNTGLTREDFNFILFKYKFAIRICIWIWYFRAKLRAVQTQQFYFCNQCRNKSDPTKKFSKKKKGFKTAMNAARLVPATKADESFLSLVVLLVDPLVVSARSSFLTMQTLPSIVWQSSGATSGVETFWTISNEVD